MDANWNECLEAPPLKLNHQHIGKVRLKHEHVFRTLAIRYCY